MASTQYVDSERYRQMLVRDGERRFQEWHDTFLRHQKAYRAETERRRKAPRSGEEATS